MTSRGRTQIDVQRFSLGQCPHRHLQFRERLKAVVVARPIVASIKEQLGLRVVPARGTVEILGIDHAEKPSAG
jgi:uncharacterized protein (TIGR03435 family)